MMKRIRDAFNALKELGIIPSDAALSRTIDEETTSKLFIQICDDLPMKIARTIPDEIVALLDELQTSAFETITPGTEVVVEKEPTVVTEEEAPLEDTPPANIIDVPGKSWGDLPDYFNHATNAEKIAYLEGADEETLIREIFRHVEKINEEQKRKHLIVVFNQR